MVPTFLRAVVPLAILLWPWTGAAEEAGRLPLEVDVFPGPPWAQRAAPLAGDPLQSSPVSATIFDRATVGDAKLDEVEDAIQAVPGASFTSFTGNGQRGNIVLRGVGNQTLQTTAELPVGFYIDDVFLGNPAAINTDLLDVARIEVLRGPQGTRGGRNSIAGAVRIDTIDPGEIISAESKLTLGNFELRKARAAVDSGRLDGWFANRFTASITGRDGTVENLAGGDEVNTLSDWGLRNQSSFVLGPDLQARLSLDFADYSPIQTAIGPFETVIDQEVTLFDTYRDNRQLYGAALELDWYGEDLNVHAITAIRGLHYDTEGSDFSGANLLLQMLQDDQAQISQEVRFSGALGQGLDWVAGWYLFGEILEKEGFQQFNNLAPVFGLPVGHRETSVGDQSFLSTALFGEATWHVTPRLDVSLGARLTYDRKDFEYRHFSNDGIGVLAPVQSLDDEISFLDISPRLGLSYRLEDNVTVYGTVARGYKGGGFNSAQVAGDDASFDEETALNYEIGVKSTWLGDRLVVNAAAFWFDWYGQQIQNVSTLGLPTVNAERSRSRGADVTFAVRPFPGVDIVLGAAYTDATFVDFDDFPGRAGVVDATGNRVPLASDVTVNAGVQFRRPLSEDARWFARVDYAYRSGFFFDAPNAVYQPGFHLLGAKAGIETDSVSLYAWGKNLLDEGYRISAADNGINGLTAVAGEPRSFGLELKVRF